RVRLCPGGKLRGVDLEARDADVVEGYVGRPHQLDGDLVVPAFRDLDDHLLVHRKPFLARRSRVSLISLTPFSAPARSSAVRVPPGRRFRVWRVCWISNCFCSTNRWAEANQAGTS